MSGINDISKWQQDFIASNLLVLGYNAWVGHLSCERGAVTLAQCLRQ